MRLLTSCSLLATAALVAACATPTGPAGNTGVLAPNANLVVQGIPPVPMALVNSVQRYTEFRGTSFVDWHPNQREMLVAHRLAGASVPQLFRLSGPMADLEPLTEGNEPVTRGSYDPRDGHYLVFQRSSGGSEADQLYRLDLDTRLVTPIGEPNERHAINVWLHGEERAPGAASKPPARLVSSSVPLDRTAEGGKRASVDTSIWLTDPLKPEERRKLAELPGGGWEATAVSPDDRQLALTRYISANESEIWLLDMASGQRRQLLPAAGATAAKASYTPAAFQPDGKGLIFTSDRDGEFQELMRLDLASGAVTRASRHIHWDVSVSSQTEDGTLLAVLANEDGMGTLHLFDGRTVSEVPQPKLPEGTVAQLHFHPATRELAFAVNNSAGPGQLYSLNPASGQVQQWTQAFAPEGLDASKFARQQIVRWKSFDGLGISGLITRAPAARFPGKRPVLIDIHGGPEGQSEFGFNGRANYFIDELGVTLIRPNVRGSSGYGKTFLALDNGFKREDSVKDIGALLDWIATQPDLDASRVLVTGGSYGGYMSLAVATNYSDRIAGNIDVVGISHFVTFLNNTESYRRDLRRVEYGDERDPAMKAHLEQISPLTNAAKIHKPIFVIQGKNDPRVPYTEAEQIVAKVRANGTPVWYLRAENEGHGFRRKENADYQFYAMVLFMQQTLLKPQP
ncbi:prolyl oligopeptidase family serine peptidase [Ideonella azotifigens]|uniref:S9 family peptidase n=1 Tax=Ideonella azotifigens TaxID=513160 RepID=UPI00114498BD|nr:prolyl oligopeptidase family serine peptidase [Ideonella azotifigens]MCD2343565.1 prolyl oligopeptidase family serine peptidase [Ideonella azotifigens]